jgi:signal transduction histidine kinase
VRSLVENAVGRFRCDHTLPAAVVVEDRTHGALVQANVETFEEALAKILVNAWESYGTEPPEDAVIEIEIANAVRDGRAFITFAVHDRGNGLDPSVRDNVFEPFVSTKSTVGVGMGLTIARHGIRNLGGDITLESRSGGGVTARIHLPTAVATASAA